MKTKLTIYTTGCPKCKILESKLTTAQEEYTTVSDIETMQALGLMSVPWLKIETEDTTEYLDFLQAVQWINNKEFEKKGQQ